jgi:hypothetical protein
VMALALIYFGCALYWQVAAVTGIRNSGGVGQWSDAIFSLAEYLQQKYPTQEIKVLDWGLEDNLFVLTDGKIHAREIYGDVTSPDDPRWEGEIRKGGIFLMNGPSNRQMPVASTGFLNALETAHPALRRFSIPQRSGIPYAMILEIQPNSPQESREEVESRVLTGDPRFAKQLEGFNQIEPGGWRWTTREFAVNLKAPDGYGQAGARLALQLFIPDSSIQKLGAVTLTARVGDRVVGSATYSAAGDHTFTCNLEPAWLKAGANRVAFALDKSVPSSASDGRELGVVVSSASLEPK